MTGLPLDRYDTAPAEVEQRRRAAIRSGRPAWLWPDVARTDWRASLGHIEKAIRAMLTRGSAELAPTGNSLAFCLGCYTSGTGPLLGWWHERGLLRAAAEEAEVLELHLRHNRIRAEKLRALATAAAEALAGRGIRTVGLKGVHTAADYFPEAGTRPASDIDLLVAPGDAPTAEIVLGELGLAATSRGPFESSWQSPGGPAGPRSLWLSHADDPCAIDLHHSLKVRPGARTAIVDLDLADPMSGGRPLGSCPWLGTLGQPLLLLHLAVHAGIGFQNLTMLRLVELDFVIRRDEASGKLCWRSFLDLAGRTGSRGYCYPALMMCEQIAPGSVPESVLRECRHHAPPGLVRMLEGLRPATVQRVDRNSMTEHFMWAGGWRERLSQLAGDVTSAVPFNRLWPVYERRAWQVMRGTIGRG